MGNSRSPRTKSSSIFYLEHAHTEVAMLTLYLTLSHVTSPFCLSTLAEDDLYVNCIKVWTWLKPEVVLPSQAASHWTYTLSSMVGRTHANSISAIQYWILGRGEAAWTSHQPHSFHTHIINQQINLFCLSFMLTTEEGWKGSFKCISKDRMYTAVQNEP